MKTHYSLLILAATSLVGSIPALPVARGANSEDAVEAAMDQSEPASKVLGERQFFVMPIPIYNPTIGTGLGATEHSPQGWVN